MRYQIELVEALRISEELNARICTLSGHRDVDEEDAEIAALSEARLSTLRLLRRQRRCARAEARALRLLLAYAG